MRRTGRNRSGRNKDNTSLNAKKLIIHQGLQMERMSADEWFKKNGVDLRKIYT